MPSDRGSLRVAFSQTEVYMLHDLVARVDRIGNDAILVPQGLTMRDFYMLTMVSENSGCTHHYLCDCLGLSPASVSLRVKDLSGKGLLEQKVNSRNRKECFLRLSPKGVRVVRKLNRELSEAFERLLAVLGENRKEFRESLGLLVQRLRNPPGSS